MFDQIIDTMNALVGVGSLVVSILVYKESKSKNKSKGKGKGRRKKQAKV
ncbi:MAG: hypothetical protein ACQEWW_26480 [Bacillota bacterium]